MSEKKDVRPFWQQLRDKKLGGLKPADQKKEWKQDLKTWFEHQATMSPANCENCKKSLAATIHFHPRAHICHIVPKEFFKSVQTHPLNRFFGCLDCHTLFDKGDDSEVELMPIIPTLRERVALFINDIAGDEIRRLKYYLKNEKEKKRSRGKL